VARIADAVGRVLGGRYRLLAPIGSGASAVVYVAEDVTLHRRVAVKLLHGALSEDDGFLGRFRDEARAAAALTHPNIMRVYDWGEDDDGPFLVLELLSGGSLRDILDAGHLLTPSQSLVVGIEAARGLDYAHRRGLVHRDIKPANLLFDDEARLCIADFGLARALAEATLTEPSGALMGTARYAAPEQARGGSLDGSADVYALALVMVEAVTGRVPFSTDTTIGTLMARVGVDLVVPPELGPLVPVLARAGASDPEERPNAGAFARQLDAVASKLPGPAPLPLSPPTDETAATIVRPSDLTQHGATSATKAAAPSARGRRILPAAAFTVALLLVLAAGAVVVRRALVPSHPVPELTKLTLAVATQKAKAAKFDVKVTYEDNETTPAGLVLRQDPAPGQTLKENQAIHLVVSRGPPPVTIPVVTGVDQATATRRLEAVGLRVGTITRPFDETHPAGAVIDFSPKGQVPKGTAVDLVISAGRAPVAVPDVAGSTYDAAATELRRAGFVPSRQEVFDDTVEVGKVVATTPPAGAEAQPGAKVVVKVSKGPETIPVPDVVGKKLNQAQSILTTAGFQMQVYGPGNRVFSQSPAAGDTAKRGSTVKVFAP